MVGAQFSVVVGANNDSISAYGSWVALIHDLEASIQHVKAMIRGYGGWEVAIWWLGVSIWCLELWIHRGCANLGAGGLGAVVLVGFWAGLVVCDCKAW